MLQITKLACTLSALAVLASCAGGPQSTVTPPPFSTPPPAPATLRVLYRVLYSGTDRMTSADFAERNTYPFDGEIYYVSDQLGSGRTPLNRYLNAGATDHADGTTPPDGETGEDVVNINVWAAVRGNGDVLFPAGDGSYNTYVITESLQNVTARMDDLYRTGVH